MKITNKLNLPENFVRAVSAQYHKSADISVTGLEKSPREYWLTRRHDAEIEVDVSEMIYALFGSALHHILEKGATADQLTEQYLTAKLCGITLSGTADLLEGTTISDYKTTSVYTIIFDSRREDWTKQLNVYKYLYELAGFEVKQLVIWALLRDWSKSKARYDTRYPQEQVRRIDIPIWPRERTIAYITERINTIMAYKDTPDDDLPLCTDVERWRKEAVYKCMKEGQVKSKKNFDNKADAEKYCEDNKLTLVEIHGECTKCVSYCDAYWFCKQAKEGTPPPVSNNEFEQALQEAKRNVKD